MLTSNWRFGESAVFDSDDIGVGQEPTVGERSTSESDSGTTSDSDASELDVEAFHASVLAETEAERNAQMRKYLASVYSILEEQGITVEDDSP